MDGFVGESNTNRRASNFDFRDRVAWKDVKLTPVIS